MVGSGPHVDVLSTIRDLEDEMAGAKSPTSMMLLHSSPSPTPLARAALPQGGERNNGTFALSVTSPQGSSLVTAAGAAAAGAGLEERKHDLSNGHTGVISPRAVRASASPLNAQNVLRALGGGGGGESLLSPTGTPNTARGAVPAGLLTPAQLAALSAQNDVENQLVPSPTGSPQVQGYSGSPSPGASSASASPLPPFGTGSPQTGAVGVTSNGSPLLPVQYGAVRRSRAAAPVLPPKMRSARSSPPGSGPASGNVSPRSTTPTAILSPALAPSNTHIKSPPFAALPQQQQLQHYLTQVQHAQGLPPAVTSSAAAAATAMHSPLSPPQRSAALGFASSTAGASLYGTQPSPSPSPQPMHAHSPYPPHPQHMPSAMAMMQASSPQPPVAASSLVAPRLRIHPLPARASPPGSAGPASAASSAGSSAAASPNASPNASPKDGTRRLQTHSSRAALPPPIQVGHSTRAPVAAGAAVQSEEEAARLRALIFPPGAMDRAPERSPPPQPC